MAKIKLYSKRKQNNKKEKVTKIKEDNRNMVTTKNIVELFGFSGDYASHNFYNYYCGEGILFKCYYDSYVNFRILDQSLIELNIAEERYSKYGYYIVWNYDLIINYKNIDNWPNDFIPIHLGNKQNKINMNE